jgi:hypothetical protein
MHTCTYTYIHIHTHTHIHPPPLPPPPPFILYHQELRQQIKLTVVKDLDDRATQRHISRGLVLTSTILAENQAAEEAAAKAAAAQEQGSQLGGVVHGTSVVSLPAHPSLVGVVGATSVSMPSLLAASDDDPVETASPLDTPMLSYFGAGIPVIDDYVAPSTIDTNGQSAHLAALLAPPQPQHTEARLATTGTESTAVDIHARRASPLLFDDSDIVSDTGTDANSSSHRRHRSAPPLNLFEPPSFHAPVTQSTSFLDALVAVSDPNGRDANSLWSVGPSPPHPTDMSAQASLNTMSTEPPHQPTVTTMAEHVAVQDLVQTPILTAAASRSGGVGGSGIMRSSKAHSRPLVAQAVAGNYERRIAAAAATPATPATANMGTPATPLVAANVLGPRMATPSHHVPYVAVATEESPGGGHALATTTYTTMSPVVEATRMGGPAGIALLTTPAAANAEPVPQAPVAALDPPSVVATPVLPSGVQYPPSASPAVFLPGTPAPHPTPTPPAVGTGSRLGKGPMSSPAVAAAVTATPVRSKPSISVRDAIANKAAQATSERKSRGI